MRFGKQFGKRDIRHDVHSQTKLKRKASKALGPIIKRESEEAPVGPHLSLNTIHHPVFGMTEHIVGTGC